MNAVTATRTRWITSTTARLARIQRVVPSMPLTLTGETPTSASPTQAAESVTTLTDNCPSCDQYTFSRWKIIANSSSTNEAPVPTSAAAT